MRTETRVLNILSFLLCLFGAPALALMPVAQLNKPGCHSIKSEQVQSFRELLQEINISDVDRRTSISNYPEVFSPAMQPNLERISGQVFCKVGKDTFYGEARIIEDSRQIITNVHVISGENETVPDPLPSCTFSTKANPDKKIELDFRDGFYFFGTQSPDKNRRNDFALVRLKESVGDVEIPKVASGPAIGETVYMVTTHAPGATRPIDSRQLVAQDCVAYSARQGNASVLGYFATNCSSLEGDSAATFYAVRNGETVAVGFEEMGGWATNNGRPFDITNPDPTKRSFSLGLTYDEKVLSESRALAKHANEVANGNADRKVNSVPGKG